MTKCCYMHFTPLNEYDSTCARIRPYTTENDKSQAIYINNHRITKVKETKFLGVIIDEKLNWHAHIDYLSKKLRSITGVIKRIRLSVPRNSYKTIYSALFESHLSYGITVWGGANKTKINKLFILQKHCIRILFGDLEAYLDNFCTCARVREFGKQKLTSTFYTKEHTKPLFNNLQLMTVQNLYNYYCVLEIFKIIKFATPIALHNLINLSTLGTKTTIITPPPSSHFLYRSSKLWNTVSTNLIKYNKGLEISLSFVKQRLKEITLLAQSLHDPKEWYDVNFELLNLKKVEQISRGEGLYLSAV